MRSGRVSNTFVANVAEHGGPPGFGVPLVFLVFIVVAPRIGAWIFVPLMPFGLLL